MENKDLKFLKKHYGEKFAHLCRELFPTLLEHEGLLSTIISEHFGPSRSLYDDVIKCRNEFKAYIFSFVDVEYETPQEVVKKTPEELMDEAGYILFPECKTEEEIQAFEKYYKPGTRPGDHGEVICTIYLGGRLDDCRVWFAVKKNVDEIRREDFKHPSRQDEYGTSVISIQFSRGKNSTLSIKNRYNHTVNNPDATFGNDLDNIIPGLTEAFTETYGISLSGKIHIPGFELAGYRLGDDGRFYRVNMEIDDICYCENNVILNHGQVVKFDNSRYIVADNYIIDRQNGTVTRYKEEDTKDDSFIQSLGEIDKISTKKDENGNQVVVIIPKVGEKIELTLDERNQMIGLNNPNVEEIGDDFLKHNESMKTLSMQNLRKAGNYFMKYNSVLETFDAPNLEEVGDRFLMYNESIKTLSMPSLRKAGWEFMMNNRVLETFDAPNLEEVEDDFLKHNESMKTLSMRSLRKAGDYFMMYNKVLETFDGPNVEEVGGDFLWSNESMKTLSMRSLRKAGWDFMHNSFLETFDAPNLEYVGEDFLGFNLSLKKLNAPKLKNCPQRFQDELTYSDDITI